MRTISLEVRDDIFYKVLEFLRLLPEESFKVHVDETDDVFTEEDEAAYNQAVQELQDGRAISLEQAKKELLSA